jgi:hypothetical protein
VAGWCERSNENVGFHKTRGIYLLTSELSEFNKAFCFVESICSL